MGRRWFRCGVRGVDMRLATGRDREMSDFRDQACGSAVVGRLTCSGLLVCSHYVLLCPDAT
jgi:hypothetical protein